MHGEFADMLEIFITSRRSNGTPPLVEQAVENGQADWVRTGQVSRASAVEASKPPLDHKSRESGVFGELHYTTRNTPRDTLMHVIHPDWLLNEDYFYSEAIDDATRDSEEALDREQLDRSRKQQQPLTPLPSIFSSKTCFAKYLDQLYGSSRRFFCTVRDWIIRAACKLQVYLKSLV